MEFCDAVGTIAGGLAIVMAASRRIRYRPVAGQSCSHAEGVRQVLWDVEAGHGGNTELRRLGKRPYRASVLQIGSFDDEILALERAWKLKLMTREFGLNGN